MGNTSRWARLTMLAALSPAGAVLGGLLDERRRMGFTIWRSACRASGISVVSAISFTLQLLPNAIEGALLGALLVQVLAFATRHREGSVWDCLAAHAGCTIAMPAGLILCALALPVPLMLVTEITLAVLAAICLLTLPASRSNTRVTVNP